MDRNGRWRRGRMAQTIIFNIYNAAGICQRVVPLGGRWRAAIAGAEIAGAEIAGAEIAGAEIAKAGIAKAGTACAAAGRVRRQGGGDSGESIREGFGIGGCTCKKYKF